MTIAAALIGSLNAAYGQLTQRDLRAILKRSCSINDVQLARIERGELVFNPVKSRDKKEVSLCGIVRLDRTSPTTLPELRDGLNQKNSRSILAGGAFSEPPTKLDFQTLRLEKKDLEALLECKPGKCSLLVSDTLLRKLVNRSGWQPRDLEDLYAEDLIEFVRGFRTNGIDALKLFDGLSVSIPIAEQNRSLIDRAPILAALDPALSLYIKNYPDRVLEGAQTTLSWSKVAFGLKPIITITSTTDYSTGDGLPIIVTHQVYASRYMNGSVAVATVIPDGTGRFYLLFADISRSDALGGLLGGIRTTVVANEGESRVKDLLGSAKTRLGSPADTQKAETSPARSDEKSTGSPWYRWANTTMLIAGIGILVLIIVGMTSLWRGFHIYKNESIRRAPSSVRH